MKVTFFDSLKGAEVYGNFEPRGNQLSCEGPRINSDLEESETVTFSY